MPAQPRRADKTPEFVIGAYHQLWRIEKSFRMSKHGLQARPIYHPLPDDLSEALAKITNGREH